MGMVSVRGHGYDTALRPWTTAIFDDPCARGRHRDSRTKLRDASSRVCTGNLEFASVV